MVGELLTSLVPAYPTAAAVVLAATALVVGGHAVATRGRDAVHDAAPPVRPVGRLAAQVAFWTVLALAATGLGTVWLAGGMHGLPLVVHVGAGGLFAVALAVVALTWSVPSRRAAAPAFRPGARVAFWLALALGTVTSVSMFASMYPLFGTAWMERLLDVHRWAGLGTVVAVVVHARLAARRRA